MLEPNPLRLILEFTIVQYNMGVKQRPQRPVLCDNIKVNITVNFSTTIIKIVHIYSHYKLMYPI